MLSVIIPARNEQYLQKTIENVLENAEGEIEIIAICDGYWPDPPINDEPRVRIIHNTEPRGQRPAINDAAKMARGKYIMKLDAHCAVAKGFDVILARDCEYDMTMIPRMYNLNVLTWEPKLHKRTDYMYISSLDAEKPFRAQYYGSKQPKNKTMIDDIMCCMGPCFFMHKDRFWELGGCDEEHGHWGQQGIEVACKAWLSGGRLVVNKNTWFAHWFRGGGVPEGHKAGFPYHLSQKQVNKARKRSRELWIDGKWDKAVRPFQWMVDKFNPPGWHDMTIIYYTDGQIKEPIKSRVKDNLKDSGFPVVEVSNEGKERSHLQLFKNILKGTEYAKTKYVAMGEHDCLYPKEHFSFVPKKDDTFYYNTNNWFLTYKNGVYHQPYKIRRALSGLVCNRELLISAVKKRIKFLEEGGVLERGIPGACEFGIVDDYKSEDFSTKEPYIDIRHGKNFSGFRKGKNRTKNLHPWGVFHKVPEGKWYQEATINGVVMPTRRKNDTNEKRWKKFLEPLIEKGEGRFTDLGCNAGFYCRKMSDLGYLAEGVERNPEFIAHNRYWEREEPKGVRLVEGDITEYTPWTSKYTLMANIHYWLTPEQNSELEKKLKAKSLYVVLIGRYKTLDRHASPCTLEYLQELFKDWEEVKVIHDKKHFSVMFKNKYLVEKDVDDITFYQQFIKSKKFLPSFNEYIDKTLAGEKFDRAKSDYADYLRWRQFRSVGTLLRRHTKLIQSMKKDGIREPLVIGRTIDGKYDENRLYDGDHRLIIAKKLGINKIICLKN